MNKKIIIIGSVIILSLIVLIVIVINLSQKKDQEFDEQRGPNRTSKIPSDSGYQDKENLLTPSPIISEQKNQPLYVVLINPKDTSVGISLDKKITLSFNRIFKTTEFTVSFVPDNDYTVKTDDQNYELIPNQQYNPGTLYQITIHYTDEQNMFQTFSFTTQGPTPKAKPDTQPTGAVEEVEEFQKTNAPNVFLYNHVPFNMSLFSIKSEWDYTKNTDKFIITLKGDDKAYAKEAARSWMRQIGLTTKQIDSLNIVYQ